MKKYFEVLADNGKLTISSKILDKTALSKLIPEKYTGKLCLMLMPLEQYYLVFDLIKAVRKWKNIQDALEEQSEFGFDQISKDCNEKIYNLINRINL